MTDTNQESRYLARQSGRHEMSFGAGQNMLPPISNVSFDLHPGASEDNHTQSNKRFNRNRNEQENYNTQQYNSANAAIERIHIVNKIGEQADYSASFITAAGTKRNSIFKNKGRNKKTISPKATRTSGNLIDAIMPSPDIITKELMDHFGGNELTEIHEMQVGAKQTLGYTNLNPFKTSHVDLN